MEEVKDLDEWGYDETGGNVDIYTHDSGTAQIRVLHRPDEQYEYRVRFQFEGGDGIIEVTAYDSERADTWEEAETAVREYVQFSMRRSTDATTPPAKPSAIHPKRNLSSTL